MPHVAVLVLTMHDDDETVFAAVRAGARGYVLKGTQRAELIRAIRAVAAGEAIFGPAVARRLMAFFARPAPHPDPAAFPELTDREREILELVARGRSNADITAELVLSPKTVRNHVSNIFSKLQVRDRAEAIVRAREAGMGGKQRAARGPDPEPPGRDTDRDTGPMTAGQPATDAERNVAPQSGRRIGRRIETCASSPEASPWRSPSPSSRWHRRRPTSASSSTARIPAMPTRPGRRSGSRSRSTTCTRRPRRSACPT